MEERDKSIVPTRNEYNILLYLRKRPQPSKKIYKKTKPESLEQWNIWMSDLSRLYYVEPKTAKVLDLEGTLFLNDTGETVAQAEFDRRFDMYFTRVMALLALLVSAVAICIDAIQAL